MHTACSPPPPLTLRHRLSPARTLLAFSLVATSLLFFAPPARPAYSPSPAQLPTMAPSPARETPAPPPAAPTKTEQYTLSHERWEKAVAYSRAGYTLYFIYYLCVVAGLLMILRLGIPARLRDFSEKYFGEFGGYAQQYLFHHARSTKRTQRTLRK